MITAPTSAATGRDAAAWRAADLERDTARWTLHFDDAERADLLQVLRSAHRPGQPLLTYRRTDFPFGAASLARIRRAVDEAQHGLGVALIKGFPREGLAPDEFELLTWAVGLHFGVARPQDRMTRYINRVQDVGTVYRSPTGRGYSSNAELDFHVDGADVVLLSCYNQAPVGGDSMCASAIAAWRQLRAERPDLAEVLRDPLPFSRQGEQAEGLSPFRLMPVYGELGDDVFCMWVRNRVEQGEKLPGAPRITALQREAMDLLDAIVRRPDFMYSMRLAPGDLQVLSNFTALHSRTQFQDAEEPDKKRLLFRLWLATPDSPRLPAGWNGFYESIEPGVVRGGAYGQHYDDACRRFDAEQAHAMGMALGPRFSD
ncbi:TauD/TfdA family dioxygenase [Variovorax sp. J31P179]|uniref:TauD/TfdA family dioxygenase n=1 Tax=Variovorax sp. J31P179 TaxID=3053508 RepID=UPI0025753391|nr:TauD/TfdA family dioxygenase [Variovorax sp. J31P179]MDM0085586.1 TauD/TfdA family dioxygenase [Variovorax sp. J31P179]